MSILTKVNTCCRSIVNTFDLLELYLTNIYKQNLVKYHQKLNHSIWINKKNYKLIKGGKRPKKSHKFKKKKFKTCLF